MNSMIIKYYNKKCHAYHIYPPNNAGHINVIDMELPIKKLIVQSLWSWMDNIYCL